MNKMRLMLLLITVFSMQNIEAQNIVFNKEFAPQEGLIKSVEKPFRDEICINGSWDFMPVKLVDNVSFEEIKAPIMPDTLGWETTKIKVPSPWNVNGFTNGKGGDFRDFPSYPKEWENVKSGWLKKVINVPANWGGNRIMLHFEAVAGYTKVFVNGNEVGEHFDAFLPFSFDVTKYAKVGEEIEVLVWVAHGSLLDDPGKYGRRNYVAGSFWGSFIAGIWQDVYLQKYPEVYVTDTYIKPLVDKDELEIEVTVKNTTENGRDINLLADVHNWINENGNSMLEIPEVKWSLGDKKLSFKNDKLHIDANSTKTFILKTKVNNSLDFWSPNNPNLYGLLLSVDGQNQKLDLDYTRFGWRQFKIVGDDLLLNGEPIVIKGDSWHFTGVSQMTRRYAYSWYQMLREANANGVRLHAQVFPRFYLEMADEMGMCILDETSIWASDGGPKIDSEIYWEACREHVKDWVLRDRNYPSVFGWSVCNETLPVTKYVFNAPMELMERNITEINNWIDITREYDTTRDWISGDGEEIDIQKGSSVKSKLPTTIIHYGNSKSYKRWAKLDMPWGVGETGMAYYGSPSQIAEFNGDRAYESQLGRMEGLAAEAFELISLQRESNASYVSVFNIAWYAIKPLELGLNDISRAPEVTDGIFFGEFVEGKSGYQPERLGPYSSTFNPGYDPSLPLYQPWPLFDGIKAAYADNYKETENIWKVEKDNTVKISKARKKKSIAWLSSDKTSNSKVSFENIAVKFENIDVSKRQLILVDGENPPATTKAFVQTLNAAMQKGSTVLFWNTKDNSKELIEAISNNTVEFYERNATSYLIKGEHPIVRKERNSTYYFSELTKEPVSNVSIGGNWVEGSNLILEACNTDWLRWNYNGEDVKTGNVYRSEREAKNPGSVIVQQSFGKGELIVSTIDLLSLGDHGTSMIRSMISNLGGKFKGTSKELPKALNKKMEFTNALYLGPFPLESDDPSKVFINNHISEKELNKAKLGTKTNSKYWSLSTANDQSIFDIKSFNQNSSDNSIAYLSFWMYSPRSLTDLLIEPDMPRLDMNFNLDHAIAININGKEVKKFLRLETFNDEELKYEGFPLEKGWNHVLIKLVHTTGDWKLKMNFTSTKPEFLKEIKTISGR